MVRAALLTLLAAVVVLVGASPAVADPVTPTTTRGALLAVSCPSETFCAAAGSAPEHVDDEEAAGLVDVRDATGWHPKHVQPRDTYTEFYDVACTSATSCLAVGEDSFYGQGEAATWDGSRWTLIDVPRSVYAFHAIDCPTATTCIALGLGTDSPQVAATWNGSRWTVTPIGGVAGSRYTFLEGVSCLTTRWCLAVGRSVSSSGVATAASALFSGTTWTWNPSPAAPAGTATSTLLDVDCHARTSCVATGDADRTALAEVWDGTTWTPTTVPIGTYSSLAGVSCATASRCLAVGSTYDATTGTNAPSAATWDGTSWTATPPPVAATAASQFFAVSCTAPNRCTAVGLASTRQPRRSYTVAERWTGTRWIPEAT